MVKALIPDIVAARETARLVRSIVHFGSVIAVRSTGGVSAGRDAILEPSWEPVGTLVDIPAAPTAGGYWRLAAIDVVDGGDYDIAPIMRLYDVGTAFEQAQLTAVLSDRTIAHVDIGNAGVYTKPGMVRAHGARRSYFCDVEVHRAGGRTYVIQDCLAASPVRVGNQVQIVSNPANPHLQGVYASPTVPRRPYIWTDPAGNQPVEVEPRYYRLARVGYDFLGWRQAFNYSVSGPVTLTWPGMASWDQDRPTSASLELEAVLMVRDPSGWRELETLADVRGYAEVDAGGVCQFHWGGVFALDDGKPALRDALAGGAPACICIHLEGRGRQVSWYDTVNGWTRTAIDGMTPSVLISTTICEVGGGTY